MELLILLGVLTAVAVLTLLCGADSRDGRDWQRLPAGALHQPDRPMRLTQRWRRRSTAGRRPVEAASADAVPFPAEHPARHLDDRLVAHR